MDATRTELLDLLLSLDINLPRKTKLSQTELQKKLSKALDAAQYLPRVVPSIPFDPSAHAAWNRSNQAAGAIWRHSFGEVSTVQDSRLRGKENPFPLYQNPFMDLRQSIMLMAKKWDEGRDTFIFRDKEDISNIALRIVEVREFDQKTPVLVVIFRHDLTSEPTVESFQWMANRVQGDTAREIYCINATLLEQQLLLRLLKQNSVRLVSSYNPTLLDSTEWPFTLSFIIPVGPLGEREMGSFNKNDGCSVCGEPAKNKCSRCTAIRYCGPVCQKEDWKAHRPTCKSLTGGTWRRLTFTAASQRTLSHCPPGTQVLYANRFTNTTHAEEFEKQVEKMKQEENGVLNIHGEAPFVVKVQLNSHAAGGPSWGLGMQNPGTLSALLDGTDMLIYDRQRTFRVNVLAWNGERGAFNDVASVVRQGYQGLKTFCWAIRSGDSTVDVCIDRLPEWQNW
ncbi:hypothetical protein JB92DRAFT_3142781 [Gautieria morchelliformis]|nr:hypothetical protein JB92DRAFT_3142781 [Gautieria morchelliformis]